jgi:hypothetical protein
MYNVFTLKQPKRFLTTLLGAAILAALFWALNKLELSDLVRTMGFLVFLFGAFFFLSWPAAMVNHLLCKSRMRKIGVTGEQIAGFNAEYSAARKWYKGYTNGHGSAVALTDGWVYELSGGRSALFPISQITKIRKDVEYYSGKSTGTNVFVSLQFSDSRSVRLRVRKLDSREAVSKADKEFQSVVDYLAARCPRAERERSAP